MVTTSPDNLWSPNASDPYNLTTDLAAMQSSVQAALTARKQTYRTDLTDAQRAALPADAKFEGLRVWTTDTQVLWIFTGGGWVNLSLPSSPTFTNITSFGANWSAVAGYTPRIVAFGKQRFIEGAVSRGSGGSLDNILTIPNAHLPASNIFLSGGTTSGGVSYNPYIVVSEKRLKIQGYGGGSATGVYPLSGSWWVS